VVTVLVLMTSQYPTVYVLESVLTSLMCVINPLPGSLLWIKKLVRIAERSYNSDVCSQSFCNKSSLNFPRVIHTEERPLGVLLVTNHSDTGNLLAVTFPCTV